MGNVRRPAAPASTLTTIDDLCVELVRKRVRNINLRVRSDGTVTVSAPSHVPLYEIERFVRSRRSWIEGCKQRRLRQTDMRQVGCAEGNTVTLWGNGLICHVVAAGEGKGCSFEVEGPTLWVRCPPDQVGNDSAVLAKRDATLDAWLCSQLKQRIEEMLPHCQELVGKACSRIRLKPMTSRWGSCNVRTAAISLSTHLVHYDPRCLEYVLIHELCHLHEPSHNARFHALMDQFCPDWKERKALLSSR